MYSKARPLAFSASVTELIPKIRCIVSVYRAGPREPPPQHDPGWNGSENQASAHIGNIVIAVVHGANAEKDQQWGQRGAKFWRELPRCNDCHQPTGHVGAGKSVAMHPRMPLDQQHCPMERPAAG